MEMDLSTSSPSYSGKWQCLIVFNLHEFEHLKATTFVYKIEEKNIKPRLKKVTEVNFECEAEAAGGMINSLEWTLNGNVVKSENLNLPPKNVSTFSVPADRGNFGSTISCKVSRLDQSGTNLI